MTSRIQRAANILIEIEEDPWNTAHIEGARFRLSQLNLSEDELEAAKAVAHHTLGGDPYQMGECPF